MPVDSRRARSSARRIADHWFDVHTGGDLAFLVGVLRALVEAGGIDDAFVRDRTTGFAEARGARAATGWERLERESGATREPDRGVRPPADRPAERRLRLVDGPHAARARRRNDQARWSTWASRAALSGEPNRGLVPIRGHSGVQGGAEVGCVPASMPPRLRGGRPSGDSTCRRVGLDAAEMVAHAADGEIDVFWMVGGNFLETFSPATVRSAKRDNGMRALRNRCSRIRALS